VSALQLCYVAAVRTTCTVCLSPDCESHLVVLLFQVIGVYGYDILCPA